jgi:hypothetical protein
MFFVFFKDFREIFSQLEPTIDHVPENMGDSSPRLVCKGKADVYYSKRRVETDNTFLRNGSFKMSISQ